MGLHKLIKVACPVLLTAQTASDSTWIKLYHHTIISKLKHSSSPSDGIELPDKLPQNARP